MIEKRGHSQLELFSQTQDAVGSQVRERHFLNYIRRYEKTLLLMIIFVITGVTSFALGVKQGKKINLVEQKKILPVAEKIEDKKEAKPKMPSQIPVSETLPQLAKYTIQVATFRTHKQAEEEAQTLKKKGFTTLVLPKGKYMIVCVGNFPDKSTAESLILKLKKRYADCYIRRL